MSTEPLTIEGVHLVRPSVHRDQRGGFFELFQQSRFTAEVGHAFPVRQINCSVSHRDTLRGVHAAAVPPGQAKYVTCVRGRVLDVVVDIRVGSPTFGDHCAVTLDGEYGHTLSIAQGLGHAFMTLSDEATVVYLCSQNYAPDREFAIHPLDRELKIPWPEDRVPVLSTKDQQAPGLPAVREQGLLPRFADCRPGSAAGGPS